MKGVELIWHGHSCFTVRTEDGAVVLDPYRDGSVPGLAPIRLNADRVLCSHLHADHSATECVSLSGRQDTLKVIQLPSYHDSEHGARRGKNTIHVVVSEGMRAVHLGDLGCDLTQEQLEILKGADVLMLPVGGFFTIGAEQAKKIECLIQPRITVPMHYRSEWFGHPEIGPVEDYLVLCSNVVRYQSNRLEIGEKTAPQTAVLTCPGRKAEDVTV